MLHVRVGTSDAVPRALVAENAMPNSGDKSASYLVPLMRYRDVGVATEWLCAAFGFVPHFAAKAPDGSVFYAELRLGDSMIMLGAVGEPNLDAVMRLPKDDEIAQTQGCYVVVEDVDTHYAQATRWGAALVLDIRSDDMGGRGYSCRDLDGHVWNFGTYDPWKAQGGMARSPRKSAAGRKIPGLGAAIAMTLVLSVVSGWVLYANVRGSAEPGVTQRLRDAILGHRADAPSNSLSTGAIERDGESEQSRAASAEVTRAQRTMAMLKDELERERQAKSEAINQAATARATAERAAAGLAERDKTEADRQVALRAETAKSRSALGDTARAESTIALLRSDLAREQAASKKAQADADAAQQRLDQEIAARDAALKSASESQSAIAKEREEKEAAHKALADAGVRIASLEQELKKLKEPEAARTVPLRRNSISAARQRSKEKAKPAQTWPYSEW